MRRHSSSDIDINKDIDFAVVKKFVPYLLKHKARIGVALLFLVLAKTANVGLPFVLKYAVDDLSPVPSESIAILVVPLALLIAYGVLRFSHVLFGEVRDSVFGRATERMIHEIALTVFNHLQKTAGSKKFIFCFNDRQYAKNDIFVHFLNFKIFEIFL